MIGIIDYKLGNLANVFHAVNKAGYRAVISDEFSVLRKCSGLILPGVGAFEDGINALDQCGMIDFLNDWIRRGKYLLGICLGMQLLYEKSYENGLWNGLGCLRGNIVRFEGEQKVPHMGWNSLHHHQTDALTENIRESDYVYFVHSYYARVPDFDEVLMYADYGVRFPAVVRKDNVIGMQFHPEKSALAGKILLENYLRIQT